MKFYPYKRGGGKRKGFGHAEWEVGGVGHAQQSLR